MKTLAPMRPRLQAALVYSAAALLALGAAVLALRPHKADFHVPWCYALDSLFLETAVKGMMEHGWYLDNPNVGAPGRMELADFPTADNLHFGLMKLIGLATGNVFLTINLYFLLTFPLAALAALFVLRRLGISSVPGLFAAVLFAVLPCHFLRGANHLFLASYYLVPLAVLVALWLYSGEPVLLRRSDRGWSLHLFGRKSLAAIVVCLLLSAGGMYYAFFACIFLMTAGLAAAVRQRAYQPALAGALLVLAIVGGTVANLAPTFIYRHEHGRNPSLAHRGAQEAEIFGLKVVQLVLPIPAHRLPALARLRARYDSIAPLSNENGCASLGILGTVGFAALLGWALLRRRNNTPQLPDGLSLFTLVAVLVGTIGGFGSLFSLLVFSDIRCYNRISVYIAFFALAMVAWGLDRFVARFAESPRRRWVVYGVFGLLLVLGVFDQSGSGRAPPYQRLHEVFAEDAAFVAAIEARVPPGTAVMQLPYVPFPENGPVHDMTDYDHFRPYLHSHSLRWSYGAVRGREEDQWQNIVTQRSPESLVNTLALSGFGGIYINRAGYEDHAAESLVHDLDHLLGMKPICGAKGQFLFYDLTDYTRQLRATLGDEGWETARRAVQPILWTWGDGFSGLENDKKDNWRWGRRQAELWANNQTDRPKQARLTMDCCSATADRMTLTIQGLGLEEDLAIDGVGTKRSRIVTIPPGRHRMLFTTDAPRPAATNDGRQLRFRVCNFASDDVEDQSAPPVSIP